MNSARSLLLDALAQSDVDMNFHKLLNLDTSNLSISGLPPSVTAPPHEFLNSWDRVAQQWGAYQPAFTDIAGNLTATQQTNITQLGVILVGQWRATVIASTFVPDLASLRPPSIGLNLNNQQINNLANPSNPLDAVNFQTMNAMVPGLQVKAPAAAATTTDNPLIGLNPVDGYTPSPGDRILVKNQAPGSRDWQNGVWIAATGAWSRASDMSVSANFNSAYVFVRNGVVNGNTAFVQITPPPVNITTENQPTNPNFVEFTTQITLAAGPGLQKIGNTISAVGTANRISIGTGINIDPNFAGQKSITILGTISDGTWQGDIIGPSYGGTGYNNGTAQLLLSAGTVEFTPPGFAGIEVGQVVFQTLSLPTVVTLPRAGTLATLAGVETLTNKSIDASNINSGVLPISVGGTGAATAMLALLNLLPSIAGQAGKSLKTDGLTVFWG